VDFDSHREFRTAASFFRIWAKSLVLGLSPIYFVLWPIGSSPLTRSIWSGLTCRRRRRSESKAKHFPVELEIPLVRVIMWSLVPWNKQEDKFVPFFVTKFVMPARFSNLLGLSKIFLGRKVDGFRSNLLVLCMFFKLRL